MAPRRCGADRSALRVGPAGPSRPPSARYLGGASWMCRADRRAPPGPGGTAWPTVRDGPQVSRRETCKCVLAGSAVLSEARDRRRRNHRDTFPDRRRRSWARSGRPRDRHGERSMAALRPRANRQVRRAHTCRFPSGEPAGPSTAPPVPDAHQAQSVAGPCPAQLELVRLRGPKLPARGGLREDFSRFPSNRNANRNENRNGPSDDRALIDPKEPSCRRPPRPADPAVHAAVHAISLEAAPVHPAVHGTVHRLGDGRRHDVPPDPRQALAQPAGS
jgi:hypothetical protein